jgi:PAS domain S-box-containing protein
VTEPDGRRVRLLGSHSDITDRKRAERALRESEELFAKAFRGSPNPIVISEAETSRCREVNEAFLQLFGFSRQDVIGNPMLMLGIWPDPEMRTQLLRGLQAGTPVRNVELGFNTKTGELRHFLISSDLIELNGTLCLITVGNDITERKRAESQLQRSHAFLRQVIDTTPNFIFAKDRDGRFTMVNQAIADAYGTTVDNLIGKTDADFNPNRDEVDFFRSKDLEVMDSLRERFIPEEKITDAVGNVHWLQTVKRPLLDDTGQATMILGAATDITERKRMEEMLRRREHDLQQAVQERERISEDLHDGILQSIYAIGLGLEACKPLISDQPKKSAAKLKAEVQRTIGQLNHVLEEVRNFIAGLESHILDGQEFDVVLRTMVNSMAASYSIPARVTVETAAAQYLSTEQAYHVMNIAREALSNSLRHSGATRITVSLKRLRRSVRLSVTDNGVGFNPVGARDVGHGLANMAARTQKIRGKLTLQSKPRQGAKVLVDIPRRLTDADT